SINSVTSDTEPSSFSNSSKPWATKSASRKSQKPKPLSPLHDLLFGRLLFLGSARDIFLPLLRSGGGEGRGSPFFSHASPSSPRPSPPWAGGEGEGARSTATTSATTTH